MRRPTNRRPERRLRLGSLSIALELLFNPRDALLEKLGLHLAEANAKTIEAKCGAAGLVY